MLRNLNQQRHDVRSRRDAPEPSVVDLATSLLNSAKRQLRVIVTSVIAGASLGAAYIAVTPKSYTAKAQLITDSRRLQISQSASEVPPFEAWSADTQVEILKSEKVLLPVIKELRLLDQPEFNRPGLFSNLFGILHSNDETPESNYERTHALLQVIQNSLEVARVGKSQIVELGFKSRDPELGARIVNAIAESFIVDQLDSKAQAARRASVWLQDRIKELGEQAATAEQAVVDFKVKNNIVDAGGKLMSEQQVAELNTKLISARSEISEALAKSERIQTILNSAKPDSAVDATVADTLKSSVVTKLRDHYLELAARAAEYRLRFGEQHQSVVRMRSQMQQIRNSINLELQRLAETYKSDVEIAKHKEADSQRELNETVVKSQATSQAQVALRELESTAHSYRALYDNFVARNAQQVQEQSMRLSEARLVSPASPPTQAGHPKTLLVLIGATIVGAFVGCALAALREMMDRVFRTSEQIENSLGIPCLALVPKLETKASDSKTNNDASDNPDSRSERIASTTAEEKVSAVSEAVGSNIDETHAEAATAAASGEAVTADGDKTAEARIGEEAAANAKSEGADSASRCEHNEAADGKSNDAQTGESSTASTKVNENEIVEADTDRKVIVSNRGVETAVLDHPLSIFSEAIHSVKLAIDSTRLRSSSKVIGVTSSMPGEGKSTISLNLARLVAKAGESVVLVDCDLRVARLSKRLTPKATSGTVEIFLGRATVADTLWEDAHTKMVYLPAGGALSQAHPTELLTSDAAANLFKTLRASYRWVIVDLPPIGPVMDAHSTAHFVDSYLFVVEWGQTKRMFAERALASASAISDHVIGAILNKVDINQLPGYDEYYGGVYSYGHPPHTHHMSAQTSTSRVRNSFH